MFFRVDVGTNNVQERWVQSGVLAVDPASECARLAFDLGIT